MHPEIRRFDPRLPIEDAWTPPASWYVDDELFALEADRVFGRHWVCAARADQLTENGSYVTASSPLGHSVVVRGEDGALRAFHNVCRHHGTLIAEGAGKCEQLTCPYHGWTYDLDGRLRSAPRSGGIRGFKREDFGLVEMAVEEWGPLVFVHRNTEARPLLERIAGLLELLELEDLQFVARREFTLRCNWKVFVDNYLDGGYHVPVLHERLAEQLDLDDYETELFDLHSIQSCRTGAGARDRLGDGAARYAWIHPNLMLNRYGPILDTNLVVPVSRDETLVVFDYWFDAAHATDRAYVDRCLTSSAVVQAEDTGICESVQKGLASPAYDRGRYAPKYEGAMLHFHRLLAGDLSASI